MTYSVFPSGGDTITEALWTTILDRGNARDYVERGLGVTLNGDGTFDVGAGLAFIRDANGQQTYPVEDETGTTGVQLATTSGTNHIYLTFDPSASDVEGSVDYHVDTDQSPPAGQPSLRIATADESTSTVTEKNRDPTISADDLVIGSTTITEDGSFSVDGSTSTTYSLSGTYDAVWLLIESASDSSVTPVMQVNGDSGSNYDNMQADGTTSTGNGNTGSLFTCANATGQLIKMSGRWSGKWGLGTEAFEANASRGVSSENANVTSPLDKVRLFAGSSFSVDVRVLGVDAP